MIEMVIVLPLLFMLLFATVEFSVLFARWQVLSNAAREGARVAVVFRSGCTVGTVEAEVRQTVKDYSAPLGISLADSDIAVTGVCGTPNSSTTVTATFTHNFTVIPNFAQSVSPSITLEGRSAMRNEGSS
jgi:Flp pilus assembly protein TadG